VITKLKQLKNTGKFYDYVCKGNELDWHKNIFIFAPNAYGKSTLANVFRSLRDSDPKIIRARRTLNAATLPEAVIIIDGVNHIFKGVRWEKSCSAIQIFDTTFIHDNILGQEIEHGHRKNIHRIIIGATGIKLADELAVLKNSEKEQSRRFEQLSERFQTSGFVLPLESFLDIPIEEENAVSGRIQKLEADIEVKAEEERVRSLRSATVLSVPSFDLIGLKSLGEQTLTAIHKEAEDCVLAHVARNFKNKTHATEFIRLGLDTLQADCPFCGQELKPAADLLAAYRQYFDQTFRAYQRRLAEQAGSFRKWNLENELTSLVSIHHTNLFRVKAWEPFLGPIVLPDLANAVEGHRTTVTGLKNVIQARIEEKQQDPTMYIDLSAVDILKTEFDTLKTVVDDYNNVVSALSSNIKDFIADLPKSDVEFLRDSLAKEWEIEKRFNPEWKRWAIDYEGTSRALDELVIRRDAKQKELENYSRATFYTYEKRINGLLLTLGADFQITDLTGKTDERAKEAYSDFAFLILEKKVPLAARQEDAPSFKNTLSEGDKSTLAFAFFIATLERQTDLDKQIVIFDDPLSSLDETRREATARLLMELSTKLNQLCVFTHKKDFLRMLCDKIPDNKIFQIRSDKKNGSRLQEFNLEEDLKSDYVRMVENMERYLIEDFGPDTDTMQGNIRKVFETVIKTKYYRTLASGIKAKGGLATFLHTLSNAGSLEPSLQVKLFNLCGVANDPHHGGIIDAPARKLSRDELILLIRDALDLIEKV